MEPVTTIEPQAPSKDISTSPPDSSKSPPSPNEGLLSLSDVLDNSLKGLYDREGVKVDDSFIDSDPSTTDSTQKAEEPEKKQESTTTEPPPAQSKEADDTPPVDPETIHPPQQMSRKAAESWAVAKKNATRAWNALRKATEENTRLKSTLADKSTQTSSEIEGMKKELEDLRGLRATVDYEQDPEFIKNFEQPAESVKNQMISMLQGLSVDQGVIDKIDFSDPGSISRISKALSENADEVTANRFLKRGEEYVDLVEKRENALKEFRSKHKEFLAERRKKAENSSIEETARMNKRVEDRAAETDDKGNPKFPFLSKVDIPPTAKKEEVARYEAHNKMVDSMRSEVQKLISLKEPEDRAEVAMGAVAARWLSMQLQGAFSKIKSLEDTLAKYNNISSERRGAEDDGGRKPPASGDLDDALQASFPQFRRAL